MTPENWLLIGPMRSPGASIAGALSGFGTIAASAAGDICAAWGTDTPLPSYVGALSLARYDDNVLMASLKASGNRGIL